MEEIKLDIFSKVIIGTLIIGILLLLMITNSSNRFERMYNLELNENYFGVVRKKEIQQDNHGMRVFYLDIKAIDIDSQFYEKIDIRDSISKKKGDHIIFLFKKNKKVLQFDYNECHKRMDPNASEYIIE